MTMPVSDSVHALRAAAFEEAASEIERWSRTTDASELGFARGITPDWVKTHIAVLLARVVRGLADKSGARVPAPGEPPPEWALFPKLVEELAKAAFLQGELAGRDEPGGYRAAMLNVAKVRAELIALGELTASRLASEEPPA